MSTTATSWLVPVRHPSPDDLELWLEKKAARGEVLTTVDAWSPLRMKFEKGEAGRFRYALERRDAPVPALYFTAREDMGWERVGSLSNIHVWRRAYSAERPAGFIGNDLGRRAALVGIGLTVVAAIALIGAIALGVVAGLADFSAADDFWIPAAVLGAIAVVAGVVALVIGVSRHSAASAEPTTHQPAAHTERELIGS
ncbi:DUF2812 domain-containing protein [Gordonia sp. HY002]|uniref:DUF2812 domain-containing protein n=1 Tax=Gordonia zhenghanii TaxID=2911516 RepID=UPI001EF0A4D9|nr:DUF2812 domain-containing protein [Gordonia zhenghanii]MCF8571610.1 DUF2812 domain-containing protein [Gordonia zhenghanii]MCF8602207.1 DUF2812 domain-containing protein [Gordonia zhenghanii]